MSPRDSMRLISTKYYRYLSMHTHTYETHHSYPLYFPLQRSAVVVHDDKGHSALTRTAASFSKASFVSSISTNGAADDLALDDPDFWTKVVGLAAKQDDGDEGKHYIIYTLQYYFLLYYSALIWYI